MKRESILLIITALVFTLMAGSQVVSQTKDSAATAGRAVDGTGTAVAEGEEESATAPLTFSYVDWDAAKAACIAKAGPIDIDEFYLALNSFSKENDLTLINGLRDYMLCRQIEYTDEPMCKVDSVEYEPFFAQATDTVDVEATLSREDRQKTEELIQKTEENCLNNAYLFAIMRGDRSLLGKSLIAGACSRFADRLGLGDNCEGAFNTLLDALDKSDSTMCTSIKKGDVRDICMLFTKMDAETAGKSGFFESDSSERAMEYLLAFKILRDMPITRREYAQSFTESLPRVATGYEKDKNYCETIYKEKILPGFCRGRDMDAMKKYYEKEQSFMEKDNARKKAREEADKKAMEAYKKRLAEEKKAKEEAAKEETETGETEEAAKEETSEQAVDQ